MEQIKLEINEDVLTEYEAVYFAAHPRAKLRPISKPYHESINKWMIMKRMAMNNLKQKWKDFIIWFVASQGYTDFTIMKCRVTVDAYYPTARRHDIDNSCPKFILDGLVDSGLIYDDDMRHLTELVLHCDIDKERPRTEIYIDYEATDKGPRKEIKEGSSNGEED